MQPKTQLHPHFSLLGVLRLIDWMPWLEETNLKTAPPISSSQLHHAVPLHDSSLQSCGSLTYM